MKKDLQVSTHKKRVKGFLMVQFSCVAKFSVHTGGGLVEKSGMIALEHAYMHACMYACMHAAQTCRMASSESNLKVLLTFAGEQQSPDATGFCCSSLMRNESNEQQSSRQWQPSS